ncbi:hypothetical protein Ddye_016109, partial [Dipteronia dyeriana]
LILLLGVFYCITLVKWRITVHRDNSSRFNSVSQITGPQEQGMDEIFTNLRNPFPSLPQKALKKIFKTQSKRLRLLMIYDIPANMLWLIEAKVCLV